MKACRTCGNWGEDFEEAGICPACAVAKVLQGDWDYLLASPSFSTKATSLLIDKLPVREDFFDKYQILEVIDKGGQGQVWKVWDFGFRRILAMKGLNEEMLSTETACYRFLAEAQITSQLKHPGILPIYDLGLNLEGRPFYTTELSNGVTLAAKISVLRGQSWNKRNLNAALRLVVRVCEIMGHVHSKGVIHRDLKPDNILVGEFGEVRVIDWGSASVLKNCSSDIQESFVEFRRPEIQSDRGFEIGKRPDLATSMGGLPCTLLFTPPELLAEAREAPGPETDIYAIGVMLYVFLTGDLPFIGRGERIPDAELIRRKLSEVPRSINRINPKLSLDLVAITERAMATEKGNRYRSMVELAEDIQAAIELRPVKARQPSPLLKTQRLIQRNPGPAIFVGCILVLLSIGFYAIKGLQARDRADRQIRALASAEADRRRGNWPQVLLDLDDAKTSGYSDDVALELQKIDAYGALGDYTNTGTELRKLDHSKEKANAAVLLRKGEYDFFKLETIEEAKSFVQSAMKMGLAPDDDAFARGLLSSNNADALECFHQALALNPYHHGARLNAIGLEYLLGLHEQLAQDIGVFKQFFPDDPTPTFLQAFESAQAGRANDFPVILKSLRTTVQRNVLDQAGWECHQIAELATHARTRHLKRAPYTSRTAASL